MTHDELLAKIGLMEVRYRNEAPRRSALRAVVELHKPYETTPPWEYKKYLACFVCEEWTTDGAYSVAYPCPTIQAIEKELDNG